MDRGPVALFGAIIAVGLGPAMWLGAQFSTVEVTPTRPPALVGEPNARPQEMAGGAGAGADTPGGDAVIRATPPARTSPARTKTSSPSTVTPSPSTGSPSPTESESSEPPSTPPTESTSSPTPPVDDSESPADPPDQPSGGDAESPAETGSIDG